MGGSDRKVLRELALRFAEIANSPDMERRLSRWVEIAREEIGKRY